MYLIDRQIKDRSDEKELHQCLNCLKRILSVLTTLTDINELEVCKGLDPNLITELVNRIIKYLMKNKLSGDHIFEYCIKILINIIVTKPESFNEV
jgi:hypothetical protein